MKKLSIVLTLMFSIAIANVTDIDGNVYETVQIGDQLWMAENLKTTHYNDGSEIPNITNGSFGPGSWSSIWHGAYGDYDNNPTNSETYGRLYNWYTVDDDRGLCMDGWHVPSDEEWTILTDNLAPEGIEYWQNSIAGGMMKSTGTIEGDDGLWYAPNEGATNESGFNALPAGYRYNSNGDYYYMGQSSVFWSSSENTILGSYNRGLSYTTSSVTWAAPNNRFGFSIRCLQDEDIAGGSSEMFCEDPGAGWADNNNDTDDSTCDIESDCCGECGGDDSTCIGSGDINGDNAVNIQDVVVLVNTIVDDLTSDCVDITGDMNGDGTTNVLDVVNLVHTIVNGRVITQSNLLPTSVEILQTANSLNYQSDKNGLLGFEFTLVHEIGCEFELNNQALIADYNTSGNTTKMIIVINGGNELFTSTGNYEIEDVLVGNIDGAINASISIVPNVFGLSNAYPNPFNPATSVTLSMPHDGFVSVKIYNMMGQLVATLHEGNLTASNYTFNWNASNVSSGMYLLQAETAGNVDTQKIMLMK